MTEPTRLDKRIAELVACSRAEAQQYIEGGWVLVDGNVVEEPQAPVTTQQVALSPDARLEPSEPATMLLHKPTGVDWTAAAPLVTASSRSESDASGVRPLKRHLQRLTPQMPMDAEASGMIVVTQDGRARRRLTEDYALTEQEFVVEVTGTAPPYGLARLAEGLRYQGRVLPRCKVSWQNEFRLRFAIKDVQPGQLRDMCDQVGLHVVAIKRIRIGRISLGKMPAGEWRYLPVGEKF